MECGAHFRLEQQVLRRRQLTVRGTSQVVVDPAIVRPKRLGDHGNARVEQQTPQFAVPELQFVLPARAAAAKSCTCGANTHANASAKSESISCVTMLSGSSIARIHISLTYLRVQQ
jgi:hypothetical protein